VRGDGVRQADPGGESLRPVDAVRLVGHVPGMSAAHGTDKKHRHDVGAPDHAAVTTEGVTRTIQVILGACIALSAILMIYALLHAGFDLSAPR
jgi:hypothetical protein